MTVARMLIFGAGSIGVYLGTVLHEAGFDVTLYGRAKLRMLKDTFLINGKEFKTPPRIYALKKEDYDVLFVSTKLYDSAKAIEEIQKIGFKPKIIAFVQNGLVEENFYKGFEKYEGFTTISVFEGYRLTDNELISTETKLGWQTDCNKAGKKVSQYLNKAGIHCVASKELSSLRALKMIMVNAIGALSAIEKKTFGEIIDNKETRNIAEQILEETYAVLKEEYDLPSFYEIKEQFYQTINAIRPHYSSIYQDLVSGRKTEIEFLNGLICRLGKKKNIPTPANNVIYERFLELL